MFITFPELVRCARAYQEEKLALLAHRYFGSGEPLRTRTQFEDMLVKAGIILCYETSLDNTGTLMMREERGLKSPIFYVKKDLDWMEQKFLIANLLGRVFFDSHMKRSYAYSKIQGVKEIQSPYERFLQSKRPWSTEKLVCAKKVEWLADEFAGAFLLPKAWLRNFVEEEKDPLRIAAYFSVSLDFLHARIKHIRHKHKVDSLYSGYGMLRKFPSKLHSKSSPSHESSF